VQKQHREKDHFSILSPCVSVREYRGSARRARGLKREGVEKEIKSTGKIPAFIGRRRRKV